MPISRLMGRSEYGLEKCRTDTPSFGDGSAVSTFPAVTQPFLLVAFLSVS